MEGGVVGQVTARPSGTRIEPLLRVALAMLLGGWHRQKQRTAKTDHTHPHPDVGWQDDAMIKRITSVKHAIHDVLEANRCGVIGLGLRWAHSLGPRVHLSLYP